MYNMIECPGRFEDVKKLNEELIGVIFEQISTVASDMYNNWVGEASEEAQASPNEDAYAYLLKHRRDVMLDIIGEPNRYSWRKRAIASRSLYLLGYDVHVEGWLNV